MIFVNEQPEARNTRPLRDDPQFDEGSSAQLYTQVAEARLPATRHFVDNLCAEYYARVLCRPLWTRTSPDTIAQHAMGVNIFRRLASVILSAPHTAFKILVEITDRKMQASNHNVTA